LYFWFNLLKRKQERIQIKTKSKKKEIKKITQIEIERKMQENERCSKLKNLWLNFGLQDIEIKNDRLNLCTLSFVDMCH
jgi:hypothetical protein